MRRVDLETAQELLWQDLLALHREASTVGIADRAGVRRRHSAARFQREIHRGRTEGRLVAAVDRLMRDSRHGAVLDDPRHPEALLEERIVLAAKPYSFLWSEEMLLRAHRRKRMYGGRRP